ncbi:MAG: alginate export family protein [Candidatus Eisenbacteria bacterium]
MSIRHKRLFHTPSTISGLLLIMLALAQCPSTAETLATKKGIAPITRTWDTETTVDMPYPRSDFGADFRLRLVHLGYAEDLGLGFADDSDRQFLRIRSRGWASYNYSPVFSAYVRLNNESTTYIGCDHYKSSVGEVIFENLFIEVKHPFGLPVGARLGRQDLFYGDGFVISDGTPLDGARTTYVNGVLLTWVVPSWSFDAFVVWNREKEEYLPRINNKYTRLIEFNEMATGLVFRRLLDSASAKDYMLEHYYIFKEEKGRYKLSTIHTLGTRLGFPLSRLRFTAELAYQAGHSPQYKFAQVEPGFIGRQTILAYGVEGRISTHVDWPLPADLFAGYLHLSGDDPITQVEYEGWNPILARWPNWSELYPYTLGIEADLHPQGQGFAFWQNIRSTFGGLVITPDPRMSLEARFMKLGASQHIATIRVDEGPKDRGFLLFLKVAWKPTPRLFGHLLYESFFPGNIYVDEARNASFVRLQLGTSL